MLKLQVCFKYNLTCSVAAILEYKNISGKTLQKSIEKEMSGNLEELLVAIGIFLMNSECTYTISIL